MARWASDAIPKRQKQQGVEGEGARGSAVLGVGFQCSMFNVGLESGGRMGWDGMGWDGVGCLGIRLWTRGTFEVRSASGPGSLGYPMGATGRLGDCSWAAVLLVAGDGGADAGPKDASAHPWMSVENLIERRPKLTRDSNVQGGQRRPMPSKGRIPHEFVLKCGKCQKEPGLESKVYGTGRQEPTTESWWSSSRQRVGQTKP